MTSNAGSAAISRGGGSGLGFQLEADGESTAADAAYDGMKRLVTDELKVPPLRSRPSDSSSSLWPHQGVSSILLWVWKEWSLSESSGHLPELKACS